MFCKFCGNQLNEEARFCPKCGNAVPIRPDVSPQPDQPAPAAEPQPEPVYQPGPEAYPLYVVQPEEKKQKKGLLIGLLAAAGVLLLTVLTVLILFFTSIVELPLIGNYRNPGPIFGGRDREKQSDREDEDGEDREDEETPTQHAASDDTKEHSGQFDDKEDTDKGTPAEPDDDTEPVPETPEPSEDVTESASAEPDTETEKEPDTETAESTKDDELPLKPEEQLVSVWMGALDTLIEIRGDGTAVYMEPLSSNKTVSAGVECSWEFKSGRVYFHDVNGYELWADFEAGDKHFAIQSETPGWNAESFYKVGYYDTVYDVRPLKNLRERLDLSEEEEQSVQSSIRSVLTDMIEHEKVTGFTKHTDDGNVTVKTKDIKSYEFEMSDEAFLFIFRELDNLAIVAIPYELILKTGSGNVRMCGVALMHDVEGGNSGQVYYSDITLNGHYPSLNKAVEEEIGESFKLDGEMRVEKVKLPYGSRLDYGKVE